MYIEEIQNCARCGGTHKNIEIKTLDNHPKYTHFASCPINGQPILVKLDDPNGNVDVMILSHEEPKK
jgi:hypothetical protein